MSTTYDIIPDIHGQFEKLVRLLGKLGWHQKNATWRHPNKDRKIIFLGDFIDRGNENRKVLQLVRNLINSEIALAVMGNHELNAIYFHSHDPKTGLPLRSHTINNLEQHKSFLREFPLGESETDEMINWFCSLPPFIDFGDFGVVHACWSKAAIDTIRNCNLDGIFSRKIYIENNLKKNETYMALEMLTKGPEERLPSNSFFIDKTGLKRYFLRLAWWRHDAKSWRDISLSVPNLETIPNIVFSNWKKIELYPKSGVPIFFGHYWLQYPPRIESENVLCLDYSAGTTGPLISYHFDQSNPAINLKNFTFDSLPED